MLKYGQFSEKEKKHFIHYENEHKNEPWAIMKIKKNNNNTKYKGNLVTHNGDGR